MPAPGQMHEAMRVPSATSTRLSAEAKGNATRGQATSDWFGHDTHGASPVQPRPSSGVASASQSKRSGDQPWYQHPHHISGEADIRGTVPNRKKLVVRCSTDEARQNSAKIKGTQESWYRHDDCVDHVADRPKSRMTSASGLGNKEKFAGRSGEWFSDKGQTAPTPEPAKMRTPTKSSASNFNKLHPTGTPGWASYDANGNDKVSPPNRLRVNDKDQVVTKTRKGNSNEWYTHGHEAVSVITSPRITSPEGVENASRSKNESHEWFNHEANSSYIDPIRSPRCKSPLAKEMIVKNRGQQFDILKLELEKNGNGATHSNGVSNGNGDANGSLNGNGHMNESSAPNETLNTAMLGLNLSEPAEPVKNPRSTKATQENAALHKGSINILMSPRAEETAPEPSGFSSPRCQSAEARQHALRDRGTVTELFNPDSRH